MYALVPIKVFVSDVNSCREKGEGRMEEELHTRDQLQHTCTLTPKSQSFT